MQITAAVSRGADTPFTIEALTLDDPGPGEVLVRIAASGICHTDLTTRASFPAGLPIVLGHEGAGIVEAVGDRVTGVAIGDHVLLTYSSCGHCGHCHDSLPGYCDQWAALNAGRFGPASPLRSGAEPVTGAFFGQSSFASHVLVTPRNLVVVDPDIDLVHTAAFGCAVQTGAGAVTRVLAPDADSTLAVFGVGGVGMSAVMAARAIGVGTVIAVDLSPERLSLAAELGADHTVEAGADTAARITALGGASHALDTTGAGVALGTALESLRVRGTLALVGLGASPLPLEVSALIGRGRSLRGSIEGDVDPHTFLPELVRWYRDGHLPMDRLIRTYPLAKIDDAVADAASGAVIKPVITFG